MSDSRYSIFGAGETALAIRTLTGVCGSKAAPAAARASAAQTYSIKAGARPRSRTAAEAEFTGRCWLPGNIGACWCRCRYGSGACPEAAELADPEGPPPCVKILSQPKPGELRLWRLLKNSAGGSGARSSVAAAGRIGVLGLRCTLLSEEHASNGRCLRSAE